MVPLPERVGCSFLVMKTGVFYQLFHEALLRRLLCSPSCGDDIVTMRQPLLAEASRRIAATCFARSRSAAACPGGRWFSLVGFCRSSATLPEYVPRTGCFPLHTVFYTSASAGRPTSLTYALPQRFDVKRVRYILLNAATSTDRQTYTTNFWYSDVRGCRHPHSRTQVLALDAVWEPAPRGTWDCHRRLHTLWKKHKCPPQQRSWSSPQQRRVRGCSPPDRCTTRNSLPVHTCFCCPKTPECPPAATRNFACLCGTGPGLNVTVGCRPLRSCSCSRASAGLAAVLGLPGVGRALRPSFFLNVGAGLQSTVDCAGSVSSTCATALQGRTTCSGLNSSVSADATRQSTSSDTPTPRRVCIVGAGPAGFYCAKYLLQAAAGMMHDSPPKDSSTLKVADLRNKAIPLRVDMLERLPAPYGLVRYGVAPDHPEIKRVAEDFDVVGQNPSVRYFGNVELGKDVSLAELRSLYDAVIFAYGASGDRHFRLEGDDKLLGCMSARRFVGFYNAHPDIAPSVEKQLPCLSEEKTGLKPSVALVIGNGNVSLDVARLLTKRRKKLQSTDVHQPALAWIARANVGRVIILGRRGWVQASFTNKELRELVTDEDLLPVVDPKDFESSLTEASKQELSESRLKQRSKVLLEQMVKNWERRNDVDCPVVHLRFLASPIRTLPHPDDPCRLGAVEIMRNKLEGQPFHQRAVQAGEEHVEVIPSSLLIWSTGFKCVHPQSVQFPTDKDGAFKNTFGRVVPSSVDKEGHRLASVFASGWARRGPHGVIASNIMDAREVATNVLKDIKELSDSASGPKAELNMHSNRQTDQAANGSGGRLRRVGQEQTLSSQTAHSVAGTETSSESVPGKRLSQVAAVEATHNAGTDGSEKACNGGGGSSFGTHCFFSGGNQELPPGKLFNCSSVSESGGGEVEKCVKGEEVLHEYDDIATLLRRRGVQFITFDDWLHIKGVERAKGQKEGKIAMKIATAGEMLRIAKDRLVRNVGTGASQTS